MFRSSSMAVLLSGSAFAVYVLTPVSAGERQSSAADCSFVSQPDTFLAAQARARGRVTGNIEKLARSAAVEMVDPSTLARRNFIDDEIFAKLAAGRVNAAPRTTDAEFLRRITLDLTGRIPSAGEVTVFVADQDPDKRDALIEKLLVSPEFAGRWTWWLADLLQVNANATNINRGINGRNAFYLWIQAKVAEGASLRDIAYQAVSGTGSNYLMETGYTNFTLYSTTPGGPVQDQYDTMLSRTAQTFLGLAYYDCILCHNGRNHLDQLSLWGRGATRIEGQQMAAFFSRQSLTAHPEARVAGSFFNGGFVVSDRTAGDYALNTTNGNRPPRCAPGASIANNRCSATMNLQPQFHNGRRPASGQNWREAFAENMVEDPMFARNFANRLWKEMFSLGLVDPVDTMDPARLDPSNPPADGWTLQATHPELLEMLAAKLREDGFDIRHFLRLIATSNAYQLSSRYGNGWKIEYVPMFARHYPRRLEAEEIHDAILGATSTSVTYTVQSFPTAVNWAMQLPDPSEPRSNGAVVNFLSAFQRGNRDTLQRSQAGSILQRLNLMNDAFVLARNKVGASPFLRSIAATADPNAAADQMFLQFLGRPPSDRERGETQKLFGAATTAAARNAAVEDLAWVLMNKVEFLFSY